MLKATNIPSLSKEDILKRVSQEMLMEYYLGIPLTDKLVRNPLRKDEHAGCSFWKSPKTNVLYFKDWAEDEMLDCFKVVMKKYGIAYRRALLKIQMDLPKITRNVEKSEGYSFVSKPKLLQAVVRKWDEAEDSEVAYWKSYGIGLDILQKYDVHPVKSVYINKKLSMRATKNNPIFCYHFTTNRIKVYRPLTKREDKWTSSMSATDIHGGKYFKKRKSKLLFITSSGKDAMVLNSFGFPAIAPMAERVLVDITPFQYKYKIVLMDNDTVGMKSNYKYHQEFDIPYTFVPLQYQCKDISDFRKKYGHKKTYRLIKRLIIETLRVRDTKQQQAQNNIPF